MLNRREFTGMFAAAAVVRRRRSDRPASPPAPPPAPAREPNLARMLRTKKLRLAVFANDQPYSFKRSPGGEWSGFCIAMTRNLASELGIEVIVVETNWAEAATDLNTGKLDLAYAPSPSAQSAMFADFADPLFHDTYAIVARKGFATKVGRSSTPRRHWLPSKPALPARRRCGVSPGTRRSPGSRTATKPSKPSNPAV